MISRFCKVMLCTIAIVFNCAVVSSLAFGSEVTEQVADYSKAKLSTCGTYETALDHGNSISIINNEMSFVGTSSQTKNATKNNNENRNSNDPWVWVSNSYMAILPIMWGIFFIIQSFMAYGTAFYKTRMGGNNGIALFGWLVIYNIAAIVPFLGIYLWTSVKNKAKLV